MNVRGNKVVGAAVGKSPGGLAVGVEGDADLPEIVGAMDPPPALPRRLHRRQEHADQNSNDHDDHQQFHQGETMRGRSPNGDGLRPSEFLQAAIARLLQRPGLWPGGKLASRKSLSDNSSTLRITVST